MIIVAAALAMMIALAAAYTLYWHRVADRVLKQANSWSAGAGWSLETDAAEVKGFPFSMNLLAQSPLIKWTYGTNSWQWQMPDTVMRSRPWRPGRVEIEASGTHRLLGGEQGDIVLHATQALAEANGIGSDTWSVWVRLNETTVRTDVVPVLAVRFLFLDSKWQRQDAGAATLQFSLDVRNSTLPPAWHALSGRILERLAAEGLIDHFPAGAAGPSEAALQWRDAGGALRIRSLSTKTEAMTLSGEGVFDLDAVLQPQGRLTARVKGARKFIDRLVSYGAVGPRTGSSLRLVLAALSGGNDLVRIPLSVRKQQVYIGPVPVFRLKPVRWGMDCGTAGTSERMSC